MTKTGTLKKLFSGLAICGAVAGTALTVTPQPAQAARVQCESPSTVRDYLKSRFGETPTHHRGGNHEFVNVVLYFNKATGSWSIVGKFKTPPSRLPSNHLCIIQYGNTRYRNAIKNKTWYKRYNLKEHKPKPIKTVPQP